MLKNIIIVGIGGFIGTILRYLLTFYVHKATDSIFPIGTLIVNLLGCFIIGIVIGLFEKGSLVSPEFRLFLTVGFCGGLTTFSTFSSDIVNLLSDLEIFYFTIYLALSVILGVLLSFAGKNLVMLIWR
jgi:CrcB protein